MVSSRLAVGLSILLIAAVVVSGILVSLSFQTPTSSKTLSASTFSSGTSSSIDGAGQVTTFSSSTSSSTYSSNTDVSILTSGFTTTLATNSSTSSVYREENSTNFTYAPHSPVAIDYVDLLTTRDTNGTQSLSFKVGFSNVGNSPIYVFGGCGSGLESSIANSSFVHTVPGGPLCLCPQFIVQLEPGKNYTSSTPGCWRSYSYVLDGPGSIRVELTLHWSQSGQNSMDGFNSTTTTQINASFTVS